MPSPARPCWPSRRRASSGRRRAGFKPLGSDLYPITAEFEAAEGERFYGLGQHQHGLLDQKGCVIDLWHRNTEVSIPFLVSNRGYGFLWHNPAVGRVELGRNATRWVAEASRQLDYWVTAGSYAEIMAHYADATGHAPMLPAWAAGFWQCKLRYASQEELLAVAREYRRRGLPLDVIVADFFHWTRMGEWRFDPIAWPDPAAMVAELDALGVKLMVSIWPAVNPGAETYAEMERRGLLVRAERGIPSHMVFTDVRADGPVHLRYYDATHPEARRFIWGRVREGYYRHGIKVWWLDACEPEIYPPDHENLRYHLGNGLEVGGLYPLLHQQAFYDGMKAEGETDVVTLCRSAWAGSQRYGAAVWSGDIASTFEALGDQVHAGLNIGLSGIPWWTSDIGGFHGGDPASPYFRELIVRWFQYGVFCPLFRLHGHRQPITTGIPAARTRSGRSATRPTPSSATCSSCASGSSRTSWRRWLRRLWRARRPCGRSSSIFPTTRLLRRGRSVHVRAGHPGRAGVAAGRDQSPGLSARGRGVVRSLDGRGPRWGRHPDRRCAAGAHPGLRAGSGVAGAVSGA